MKRRTDPFLFRSAPQWRGAAAFGLEQNSEGIWTPVPDLRHAGRWPLPRAGSGEAAAAPASMAVDGRGRAWVVDAGDGTLRTFDAGGYEDVVDPTEGSSRSRVAVGGGAVWRTRPVSQAVVAHDAGSGKVLFDGSGFAGVLDVDVDDQGAAIVLTERHVWRVTLDGRRQRRLGYGQLGRPIAVAASSAGDLAWIVDDGERQLVRVDLANSELRRRDWALLGWPEGARVLDLVRANGGFLALYEDRDRTRRIAEADSDGRYLMDLDVEVEGPRSLATDGATLVVASPAGLDVFDRCVRPTGGEGTLLLPPLDRGDVSGEEWDRVRTRVQLPAGSRLVVRTATSAGMDSLTAENLRDEFEARARATEVTSRANLQSAVALLSDRWSDPVVFEGDTGTGPVDCTVAVRRPGGRFLFVELTLTAAAVETLPSIGEVEVRWPSDSLIRYLPPFYAEEASGGDFLRRFLGLFQSVVGSVEQSIVHAADAADPAKIERLAPHLRVATQKWLASWVDLETEDTFGADAQARVLAAAGALLAERGTARGIERLLEALTGVRAHYVPGTGPAERAVLDGESVVGRASLVPRDVGPASGVLAGNRLGSDTSLGGCPDPLRSLARRSHAVIAVALDRSSLAEIRPSLDRALASFVPAHVSLTIVPLTDVLVTPTLEQIEIGEDAAAAHVVGATSLGAATVGGAKRSCDNERADAIGRPLPDSMP